MQDLNILIIVTKSVLRTLSLCSFMLPIAQAENHIYPLALFLANPQSIFAVNDHIERTTGKNAFCVFYFFSV